MEITDIPRTELFGLSIGSCTMNDVVRLVNHTIEVRGQLQIGVINAAKIVQMRNDPALRRALEDCHLVLADGMSVVWAARLLGRPLPERVAGIDLMMRILGHEGSRPIRVYFLGATQDVLDAAVRRVQREFRSAQVVGSYHGYFKECEEERIADEIRRAEPDILFVAMSSPRKERFLARWSAQMRVPVTHGVGGSLDILAGKTRRAPQRWQELGLEWLFRFKEEPRRMWRRYLVSNTRFCLLLGCLFLRSIGSRAAALVHGPNSRR